MASIFNTGAAPTFTKEQQKVRRLAWKPSASRLALQKSGKAVTVYTAPPKVETVEAAEPVDKTAE